MNNESRCMKPLQLAGKLIMENGGETYRVEETITRMGRAFGLTEVESFAVPSGIFISYRKADGSVETAVKRVRRGPINLTRVDEVNAVSRMVEAEHLNCDEAWERLQDIAARKPYVGRRWQLVAVAISSGGWAVMFGGGRAEFFLALAVSCLGYLMTLLLDKFRMQSLVSTLLGSLLAAFVPQVIHHYTGLGLVDVIVAGALMPMLPGLAMTNAVQDAMRGDMISGISHAVSAILTAVLVAGGAVMASALFSMLTGGAPV